MSLTLAAVFYVIAGYLILQDALAGDVRGHGYSQLSYRHFHGGFTSWGERLAFGLVTFAGLTVWPILVVLRALALAKR